MEVGTISLRAAAAQAFPRASHVPCLPPPPPPNKAWRRRDEKEGAGLGPRTRWKGARLWITHLVDPLGPAALPSEGVGQNASSLIEGEGLARHVLYTRFQTYSVPPALVAVVWPSRDRSQPLPSQQVRACCSSVRRQTVAACVRLPGSSKSPVKSGPPTWRNDAEDEALAVAEGGDSALQTASEARRCELLRKEASLSRSLFVADDRTLC